MNLSAFLRKVAITYEALGHTPEDLATIGAYDALNTALATQYAHLAGLVSIRFTAVDPYPSSAAMFADRAQGKLSIYNVVDLPTGHPMWRVHPATAQHYNTVFRAVHDGLAHFPERLSFGPVGEFKAFRAHCRLLAGNIPAMMALATETLGQNAVYNYGSTPKRFAEQKAALLPWNLIREALTTSFVEVNR